MRRWQLFATVVCSVGGLVLSSDADAARGCRPARRYCVGVTHQPCAPVSVRAPQLKEAVTGSTECICAMWAYAMFPGYKSYYSIDYYPTCADGHPCSLDGNFTINGGDPCPTCPSNQCLFFQYASTTPRHFKTGTKLDRKLKWDEKYVLNSGTGKFKMPGGKEQSIEFETKELADSGMLVSFTHKNTQCYAKLQMFRVEAQEVGTTKAATIADFAVGQEIETPPASQKVRDVSSQITVLDSNVVSIRVGNTTYQVVTATPLSE